MKSWLQFKFLNIFIWKMFFLHCLKMFVTLTSLFLTGKLK